MYAFLSQMFDYGNTAIEKRFMFYRRLVPLLAFGRERDGIDLSKVQLTHHSLRGQGKPCADNASVEPRKASSAMPCARPGGLSAVDKPPRPRGSFRLRLRSRRPDVPCYAWREARAFAVGQADGTGGSRATTAIISASSPAQVSLLLILRPLADGTLWPPS